MIYCLKDSCLIRERMAESAEEKEAGAVVEEGEKHEIKKKVEIQEKIVESSGHKVSTVELVLIALIAIVIGFIIAFLLPKLLERLRPREPDVVYYPQPRPYIPPPPMRPQSRKRKKAGGDITPEMIARTPPE